MGFVTIAVPYTDRWYFAEMLGGAIDRIESAGHRARVHAFPPSAVSTVHAADAIEQDFSDPESLGAIVAQFKYRADQGTRASAWGRPIVVVGGSVLGFPTVMIDDIGAARTATQHLLELGHRRIAHFAGDLGEQMDFSVNGRRARGYTQVVESAGLQPWIVENAFDAELARQHALEVLSRDDRPTAVFAVSDEIAYGVLDAVRELGLRPGPDVSVVGIDDQPRSATEDLTTIRQVPRDIGAEAASLLLSGLSHGPDPKQSRLQPISLVKRASTARPRIGWGIGPIRPVPSSGG